MSETFSSAWASFWHRDVPPHSLALLRIGLGLFLLAEWVVYLPRVKMLFSHAGLIVPYIGSEVSWFPVWLYTAPSFTVALVLYCVLGVALVLFIVGFHMRSATLVMMLFGLYYYQISFHSFPSSYHRIFFFFTFILMLSGADRTYSVRAWREEGSFLSWKPVPVWPLRIIALQICFTYFGVGLQKLMLPLWQTGEVLAYSFLGRWATPPAFWFVRLNFPLWLYDFLVECVKFLHVSFVVGVWFRVSKWWYLTFGALFHILVTVTMGMWWFLALIPAYIVFFDPEEIRKTLATIPLHIVRHTQCHPELCRRMTRH